jgi:hypothetical protein
VVIFGRLLNSVANLTCDSVFFLKKKEVLEHQKSLVVEWKFVYAVVYITAHPDIFQSLLDYEFDFMFGCL